MYLYTWYIHMHKIFRLYNIASIVFHGNCNERCCVNYMNRTMTHIHSYLL